MDKNYNSITNTTTKVSPKIANKSKEQLYFLLKNNPDFSDELLRMSISSNNSKHFVIIDDNYVILEDSESLVNEIGKCKRLRKNWVNYCWPISYREFDWKYYFLEHRAPWLQLDFFDYYDKIPYSEALNRYFSFLDLLSKAPQKHYDKFLKDIELMKTESLKPDCCSLWNLFYDTKVWFSFIDVYPCNIRQNDSRLSVSNIFKVILNPKFSYKDCHVIPKEELDRYNEYIKIIYVKILNSLKKFGYSDKEIRSFLDKKEHIFSESECVSYDNVDWYIKEHYDPFSFVIS